jgi:quercetin dioxygenase-like cupin family protein
MTIRTIKHDEQPIHEPSPGVRIRIRAGGSTGTKHLTVAERWFDPGTGVPEHRHPAGCEEAIWVLAGEGEFSVEGETARVGADHTVIVPPETSHRFTSVGDEPLHILSRYPTIEPVMIGEDGVEGELEVPS